MLSFVPMLSFPMLSTLLLEAVEGLFRGSGGSGRGGFSARLANASEETSEAEGTSIPTGCFKVSVVDADCGVDR